MSKLKGISYDAKKGVLLSIDVGLPNFEDATQPKIENLKIRVNQATGKVTLE